jgi:hypothetical protein
MGKWHGEIGYVSTVETSPGIWEETVTKRNYYGDVLKNASRWSTSSDSTNDNLNISNQISIVADPFAYQNFHSIRYVEFMGIKWKVSNLDVQYPRLLLTLGGVYNGEQA